MEFMRDIQTGPIKLRNSSNRLNLIAEIRKRPAIWDLQSKGNISTRILQQTWKELGRAMGADVDVCKRKWKILRSTYRNEVKKLELRIVEDKFNGSYDPNKEYKCNWIFYEHMNFIHDTKKPKPMKHGNSPVNDNNSGDNDSNQVSKFHNMVNIKIEPELDIKPKVYLPDDDDNSPQTPVDVKPNFSGFKLEENPEPADDKPTTSNWKYTKCSNNQANLLEGFAKDDHKLIKSSRSDIKDSNDMIHVNDSDYNFLISFLPKMKKINDLQNFQFRAQTTDLMLDIMSQSTLISEVRKRPTLWDINGEEHRSKKLIQTAWKDVAAAMGSNVNDCRRKWKSLRGRNRAIVDKIELRIQEDKQKGSYNPNNDYGSEWTYLEHMKFMNDIKKPPVNDDKSELEMSIRFKLIAEIRKRPAIWDVNSEEHRTKGIYQTAWNDVAVAMGSNVKECSRIWKILRDMSRSILKKKELRIKEAKQKGSYNPNKAYSSQWPYLKHMEFIHGMKLDNKSDDNDTNQVCKVHNKDNIKMEPESDPEKSNDMDKFKLIAEVRKRPALWDINSEEHRSQRIHQKAWKDLAVAMGSNVNDCRRFWRNFRTTNQKIVKRIKLRIQEAKLKGSYNPNNVYTSEWPYLEHMTFMNDIKKASPTKLGNSNEIDKFKLIAEMRKRPALWDNQSEEHISCLSLPEVWKDLAVSMGSDVDTCQGNWMSLCKFYRASDKRLESRIKEAKLNGSYNPNKKIYKCKWPYYEAMKFMKANTTGWIKLRTSGDKLQLIAEMRKRPELWDFQSKEHRSCLSAAEVWKDVAVSLGSDVETCQRNWVHLCRSYRGSAARLELRIQEAKQKGSYHPNNDYSSQWPYFEHMEFMKDKTTGSIKLRHSGDKFKLIAEVRKRPELWCIKSKAYKPRLALQKIWEDLAQAMGAEVDDCKLKWTRLLNGYRVEVKKLELRIKEDKLNGSYNPKKEYRSKWIFYERMKFCNNFKNPSLMELGNTFVNDINSDDNDSNQVSKFQNNTMEEVYLPDYEDNSLQEPFGMKSNFSGQNSPENQDLADDRPTTSHWKCTKRSYAQANCLEDVEKEEHNLIKSAKVETELDLDPEVYIPDDEDYDTDSQMSGMEFLSEPNSPQNQESDEDKTWSTGVLLEDIEKEEYSLIESIKVEPELELDPEDEDDDTDSQMSDSDYNFLVSFLPKMKKINELQNLQFRSKVTDLMLEIATE
ncbi:uncharacterized protein LOC135955409 [Calliphora vicina]|uniref:uncharacterized protein LOC135955409 n=1 Tax=Calliphora vicina TaxID=7373 RepID=UPI00325AF69A